VVNAGLHAVLIVVTMLVAVPVGALVLDRWFLPGLLDDRDVESYLEELRSQQDEDREVPR
jgi:hypothetical protein